MPPSIRAIAPPVHMADALVLLGQNTNLGATVYAVNWIPTVILLMRIQIHLVLCGTETRGAPVITLVSRNERVRLSTTRIGFVMMFPLNPWSMALPLIMFSLSMKVIKINVAFSIWSVEVVSIAERKVQYPTKKVISHSWKS